ncbi:leucyl/phenylalanyl-tRNA--protein transferase [Flexibacterium corallicola]|uniref:leucyl/phenylalanyl-tRNA--protein transferase n=1 Tax=Flexibacterium corallicola TaxID=3037259 RepID=UPI00286F396C|nr:leucyl/phenylalanyl-tRNA--protein transferase [Pseudovibrio sp. M1P-2-3]
MLLEITPQVLLKAYACGVFPMAESAEDPTLFWVEPERRGILPLDLFYVPSRLRRTIRSDRFHIKVSQDFAGVLNGCAAPGAGRSNTWINSEIRRLYSALFQLGHCHSVEVYFNDRLVGGLYGVSLGSVFFGESMFSFERDASKVALAFLVARLIKGGYQLLDTQFVTDHLMQFGAEEVHRDTYIQMLETALQKQADFYHLAETATGKEILHIIDEASALEP